MHTGPENEQSNSIDFGHLLTELTGCARRYEIADAAALLNIFLQNLTAELKNGTKFPPERIHKISYSLETLLMLQKANDWVGVADILEFELTQLLK